MMLEHRAAHGRGKRDRFTRRVHGRCGGLGGGCRFGLAYRGAIRNGGRGARRGGLARVDLCDHRADLDGIALANRLLAHHPIDGGRHVDRDLVGL